MTTRDPEIAQQAEQPLLYQVSFERLVELKRSAVGMVAERRPQACPSRRKPDHELTDAQELIEEVAEHWGSQDGYIRTEMPIQEIVFRVLLVRRNEPTLLTDLHYELTERWATPIRPIILTEDALARILDSDTYYGFARVDSGATK